MTPKEFRAMSAHEAEKVEVAKRIGIDVDWLDTHRYRIEAERKDEEQLVRWRVHWLDGAPENIRVHGETWTDISFTPEGMNPPEPEPVRELSNDEQAIILKGINALAKEGDPCSVCGGQHGLASFLTRGTNVISVDGYVHRLWIAITICDRCGYIREFAANAYLPNGGDVGQS